VAGYGDLRLGDAQAVRAGVLSPSQGIHRWPVCLIFLTARSELKDCLQGLEAGADEFIAKPVAPEELRARVQAGLRLQRLVQALAQANRQLQARNELLESLALTDPLTGALNRRALDQALPRLLQQVGPQGKARYRYLCLLMLDVDADQRHLRPLHRRLRSPGHC